MKRKIILLLVLIAALIIGIGSLHLFHLQRQIEKTYTFKQRINQQSDLIHVLGELAEMKNEKDKYAYYTISHVETDTLGYTHYTLNPTFNGQTVTNKTIKIHVDSSGEVVLVNGEIDTTITPALNTVAITPNVALTHTFAALNFNPNEVDNLENDVVRKITLELDDTQNKLVYTTFINTVHPSLGHWKIKIDAQDGSVIEVKNLAISLSELGTGTGTLKDTKQLNINRIDENFFLEDVTHAGKISAYKYHYADGAKLFTSSSNNFNTEDQRHGVDANYYAAQVYDYFKNTHNRESYDNQGSPLISLTHVNTLSGRSMLNNASWLGDKVIYNNGDGKTFSSLSGANDIVAHEITHGVIQQSAGLEKYGQTGALNESFADVFAFFIDNEDWLIGEDTFTPAVKGDAIRSLADPTLYKQSAHMSNYLSTDRDNGGIHTNSGIPNKAAYNTITRVGQSRAEQIYYRALTLYLTPNTTFKDAKQALYQSARDLYGQQTAYAVWDSWEQVGVR